MRLLIAIIRPTKLEAVREALESIEVQRMTVADAQGFGRQFGQEPGSNSPRSEAKLLQKVVLEIVVNEDFLERTIQTIQNVARTGAEGAIGDGKIFVLPADESIQLNDGHRGPGAV